MPEPLNADNPYASPEIDREWLIMRRRTIPIGIDEVHTLFVETSLWRGSGDAHHRRVRQFISDPARPLPFSNRRGEKHEVEVKLDTTYKINVLVDGKLVEADLFPRTRTTIFTLVAAFVVVCAVVVTIAAMFISKLMSI